MNELPYMTDNFFVFWIVTSIIDTIHLKDIKKMIIWHVSNETTTSKGISDVSNKMTANWMVKCGHMVPSLELQTEPFCQYYNGGQRKSSHCY